MLVVLFTVIVSCSNKNNSSESVPVNNFIHGVDLSYVNQIQIRGGEYKDNNQVKDAFEIFGSKGTGLARFRLWHNPQWTKELYGDDNGQLYNDFEDTQSAILASKRNGMKTLLDFHYSDTWADPDKQYAPEAWENITSIETLEDSVYNYTLTTLRKLNQNNALPEYVQLGNETNCGMFYSEKNDAFPDCNVCESKEWDNLRAVLNAGARAVRMVESELNTEIKIILHVADPQFLDWWFGELTKSVVDFDAIGVSYYPLWHREVSFDQLENHIKNVKNKFGKDIIILETAYPWTTEGNDNMPNLFGDQVPLEGYAYTPSGQLNFMKDLSTKMKSAGALGVVYWESAWIAYPIKTLWGTGSSWENCTYFDYENNASGVFDYMKE